MGRWVKCLIFLGYLDTVLSIILDVHNEYTHMQLVLYFSAIKSGLWSQQTHTVGTQADPIRWF